MLTMADPASNRFQVRCLKISDGSANPTKFFPIVSQFLVGAGYAQKFMGGPRPIFSSGLNEEHVYCRI